MNPEVKEKKLQTHKLVDGLAHLLADTYILYVKTQNFHWNIQSPNFYAYHKMLEEQYEELAEAVDVIAERMRSMNVLAPASLREFLALTSLQESSNDLSASDMIQRLLADHEVMASHLMTLFKLAQDAGDEVTLDLLIERKTAHDKTAWMLRSSS
jgi:starvation-inducible DNA-binding protein